MAKLGQLGYKFKETSSSSETGLECFNRKKSGKRPNKYKSCNNATMLFLYSECRRNKNADQTKKELAELRMRGKKFLQGE
jgi:hypothetical protein